MFTEISPLPDFLLSHQLDSLQFIISITSNIQPVTNLWRSFNFQDSIHSLLLNPKPFQTCLQLIYLALFLGAALPYQPCSHPHCPGASAIVDSWEFTMPYSFKIGSPLCLKNSPPFFIPVWSGWTKLYCGYN